MLGRVSRVGGMSTPVLRTCLEERSPLSDERRVNERKPKEEFKSAPLQLFGASDVKKEVETMQVVSAQRSGSGNGSGGNTDAVIPLPPPLTLLRPPQCIVIAAAHSTTAAHEHILLRHFHRFD